MTRKGRLVAALVLAACDAKTEPTPPTPDVAPAMATPLPPTAAAASAGAPTPSGPMALSDAIPAEAFAVAVVRLGGPWLDTIKSLDPIAGPGDDFDALREELDGMTQTRLGVVLGEVRGASVFALDADTYAAVLDGVSGAPRGNADGQGIVALEAFPGFHAVMIGRQLVIGSPRAVASALAATTDASKRLASNAKLAGWIASNTEGASAVVAIDVMRAPSKLARGLEGVDRGFAVLSSKRFAVSIEGDPAVVAGLTTEAELLVESAVGELKQLAAMMRHSDDLLNLIGSAFLAHQVRRFERLAKPVVDGGRLSLEVPLDSEHASALVAMVGIGAAIAIPELTKSMRRSKTSEARVQLARMFDAASAYFNEELIPAAGVALIASHACPNDGRASGSAGITPPLSVDCNAGPGGRCVPTTGMATGSGVYDIALWTENPVWSAVHFQIEQGHAFHYDFKWTNSGTGFGACQFTAQAFGDLDGDGVWSTYERTGVADHQGVNGAAGLYIDQEVE